jgi:PBP1b-binding outer membrane lipoprotein LpoB
MMKTLSAALLASFVLLGCSQSDPGDPELAKKAAEAAPKTVEQLPADMPPEAKRQAEGAMKQKEAMQSQMDAQAEAMKKVNAQQGR